MNATREANFDGLVGPTHHYGGLSYGNVASQASGKSASNPRQAALQGLEKMWALAQRGLLQGVLPPQARPDVGTLRRLGFHGSDAEVLQQAATQAPSLLSACASASSMWTANAATVSPSADSVDGKVHFTPANLNSKWHRSIEHPFTAACLRRIFADPQYFSHHPALPEHPAFGDEGAANHTRLCSDYGAPGGKRLCMAAVLLAARRCSRSVFRRGNARGVRGIMVRLHRLPESWVKLAQQHPHAIDAGVFHNDVIAVGNRNLLLASLHQHAFLNQPEVLQQLRQQLGEGVLQVVQVDEHVLPLEDAVSSYLFNSQLLTLANGDTLLVCAEECCANRVRGITPQQPARQTAGGYPVSSTAKQSMRNGGGPARLRLRVVLSAAEQAAVLPGVWLTAALYQQLCGWAEACITAIASPKPTLPTRNCSTNRTSRSTS
ncbi:MAG: N-succinylarginine dihydrolase [Chitinivorax sp.]